jgi:hypothetical protein
MNRRSYSCQILMRSIFVVVVFYFSSPSDLYGFDASPAPSPPYSFIDVPLRGQRANTWCWAASSEMVATYYKRTLADPPYKPPLQQWQISHTSYPPPAVTCPEKTCMGLVFYGNCSGPHTPELFHFQLGSRTTDWSLSWEAIQYEILKQRPLLYGYCLTTWPNYACTEEDNGHMVVLDGFFRLRLGNLGDLDLIRVKDPLPCCFGEIFYMSYSRYGRNGVPGGGAMPPPGQKQYRRFHVRTYYCIQDRATACEEPDLTSSQTTGSAAEATPTLAPSAELTFTSAREAATAVLAGLRANPMEARVFLSSFLSPDLVSNLGFGTTNPQDLELGKPIPRYYLLPTDILDNRFSEQTLRDFLVDSGLEVVPVLTASSEKPLFTITVERTLQNRVAVAEIGRPVSTNRYFTAFNSLPTLLAEGQSRTFEVEVAGLGMTFLFTELLSTQANGNNTPFTKSLFSVVNDCSGSAAGKLTDDKALVQVLRSLASGMSYEGVSY